jgi:hypothetical protein
MRLNEIRCANPECAVDGNKSKMFAELKKGKVLVCRSTEIEFVADEETEIKIFCNRCRTYTSLIIK